MHADTYLHANGSYSGILREWGISLGYPSPFDRFTVIRNEAVAAIKKKKNV